MVELLYYFTLLSKYYDLLLSNDMTKWTHTFPELLRLCYVFSNTVFVNHSMSIPKLNQCLAPFGVVMATMFSKLYGDIKN